MWSIISNIASICSIIALPIAVWQILELKSKVETTEKGIRRVLDIKEHEKFEHILKIVANQYQDVSELVSLANKKGKSTESITRKCQGINREINVCIVEISPHHKSILNSLRRAIEHIEKYLESNMQSIEELKEARDYLNNAMQEMKHENLAFESKAISMAAHYNE